MVRHGDIVLPLPGIGSCEWFQFSDFDLHLFVQQLLFVFKTFSLGVGALLIR